MEIKSQFNSIQFKHACTLNKITDVAMFIQGVCFQLAEECGVHYSVIQEAICTLSEEIKEDKRSCLRARGESGCLN